MPKTCGQTIELGYADHKPTQFNRRGRQRASTEIGRLALAHNGLTIVRTVQPPPNRETPEEIAT